MSQADDPRSPVRQRKHFSVDVDDSTSEIKG